MTETEQLDEDVAIEAATEVLPLDAWHRAQGRADGRIRRLLDADPI